MSHNFYWEEYFRNRILERGWNYYEQGRVSEVTQELEWFSGFVSGTHTYYVELGLDEDFDIDPELMYCDCPHAQDGNLCKHMAALLYYVSIELGAFDDSYSEKPDDLFSDGEDIFSEDADDKGGMAAGVGIPFETQPESQSAESAAASEISALQKAEHEKLSASFSDEASEDVHSIFENTASYRYFRYQDYGKDLDIPKEEVAYARKLIREGKVLPPVVRFGYQNRLNDNGMVASFSSSLADYYYGECTVVCGPHRVLDSKCPRWDCEYKDRSAYGKRGKKRLCEHELAVLLQAKDYLKEHNPGDTTDQYGMNLINEVIARNETSLQSSKELKADAIGLEPYVEIDPFDGVNLFFRVGSKRKYKIKNLPEFVENVQYKQEMMFGRNTVLQLGTEYFDEESLAWYRFVEDELREYGQRNSSINMQMNRRYYRPDLPEIKDGIPLYGAILDRFVSLMGDRPAEFTIKDYGKKDKQMLTARHQDYRLPIRISPDYDLSSNEFCGITITGHVPEFLRGQQTSYYPEAPWLYCIPEETTRALQPFLQAARFGDRDIKISIGRRHLADFYYKTLPHLKDVVSVEESGRDVILKYLAPEPSFAVYIDVDEESVLCRPEVRYGNMIRNVLDHHDTELEWERAAAANRDVESEDDFIEALLKYFPNIDYQDQLLFVDRSDDAVFDLMNEGLDELLGICEVHLTDRFRRLHLRRQVKVEMGISVEGNLLDLSLEVEDLSEEELLDLLYSYKEKKRYIRLKNGDYLKLDESETVEQLSSLMEMMRISPKEFVKGKMQIPSYRALYLDKMLEQTQEIYADRDRRFKKLIKEFKTVEDADYDVPDSLKSVLRNYQKDGYRWLRTLDAYGFGGILADEMGLGKTVQVIAVLLAVAKEQTQPSLIVSPASLVYNWQEELKKFAPSLSVALVTGTKKERASMISRYRDNHVLVTSYDLLKRDIDQYEGKEFRFMVIDEAQYIKTRTTAAAKAVKLVCAQTKFALTGTPIENRLSELWSIFDFLMPGFLYEYSVFRSDLETPIVKHEDEGVSKRLSRMVSPFVLRRRKQDVLKDLPEKLEEVQYAAMDTKQRRLYEAQVTRMKQSLKKQSDEEFGRKRIEILAQLTRIRQICCDPAMYLENYDGESAKREACMDLLQSAAEGGHKVLVFSQFTTMLELLECDLDQAGLAYYKITGATPKEKRIELVKQFNEDDTPVFLISLKAGGTGLNLTGADIVVHYDPWWNLAVQDQATDRAHRIGQTRKVTVYKLIMKNTIEEKILEMQEKKRKLADDILNSEAAGSSVISREDLLEILG